MTPDSLRQGVDRALPILKIIALATKTKVDDELVRVLEFITNDTVLIEEFYGLLQARGAVE